MFLRPFTGILRGRCPLRMSGQVSCNDKSAAAFAAALMLNVREASRQTYGLCCPTDHSDRVMVSSVEPSLYYNAVIPRHRSMGSARDDAFGMLS